MERKLLQECPVCGSPLYVRVLECPSCHTKIEGKFAPPHSSLFYLPKKDLDFVELFVRLRGNIKEVEKALRVSYPTVRGTLDRVIEKMGYPVKHENDAKRKAEILEKLEKGEISPEEAAQLISSGANIESKYKTSEAAKSKEEESNGAK